MSRLISFRRNGIKPGIDSAMLGAGCFWCIEAIYQQLKGVIQVIPGYSGGNTINPTFDQINNGTTGHVEVCKIIFDTRVISFYELLEVFWLIHDPTATNKQGNDFGTQYRSVIFYKSDEQRKCAEEFKNMLNESGMYPKQIVTSIEQQSNFYKAEDYHVNYYNLHPYAPYCISVISPKLSNFQMVFRDKLKVTEPLN